MTDLSVRDIVELELLEMGYAPEVVEVAGMAADWVWQIVAEAMGVDTKGEVNGRTAPR